MPATLAPALARLRSEVNARWPRRDRSSDGWIGDPSHQSSGRPENGGSDHNPNRRNIVDALDVDTSGIDPPTLVACAIKHPSTNYVIWNRSIWSRSRGFRKAAYTGSNPHIGHLHVSLLQTTAAENNTKPWGVATGAATTATAGGSGGWPSELITRLPELEPAEPERESVRKLQALLNAAGMKLGTDGVFGPLTTAAVRSFQQARGLDVDGIVGPRTWAALLGPLPLLEQDSEGADVVRLQHLLNAAGAGLDIDGDFGPLTGTAVREYQARMGLTVDAIVGQNTWTALLTR